MAKDLFDVDEIPPKGLLADLRILLHADDALMRQAQKVLQAAEGPRESKERDEAAKEAMAGWCGDKETLRTVIAVSRFLVSRAAQRNLDPDEFVAAVVCLAEGEQVSSEVRHYLKTLAPLGVYCWMDHREATTRSIAVPELKSISYACDLRPVYASAEYDSKADAKQPYFRIRRWVPVVLFELVTDINDDTETTSFLLSGEELLEFHQVISRSLERLKAAEASAAILNKSGDPCNDNSV